MEGWCLDILFPSEIATQQMKKSAVLEIVERYHELIAIYPLPLKGRHIETADDKEFKQVQVAKTIE